MANSTDWGLTELGFRRPSYAEILDGFEYQAREKFTVDGKTPDLTVRSPLGLFLRIWAWIVNLLFQLLEDVYNSQFVDTAVGASLYQLGRNIGMKLLPAQRASGNVQFTGTAGTSIPVGYLVGTIAGIQYAVVMSGVIGEDGTVTLPIQCTELGTIGNVAENTVTQIINPLEGVESTTNPAEISGGRTKETDEEFRDRYYRSVDLAGGVNADAIQAEILQSVEGVLGAIVYENETDFEDARGLPAHSIEAVVHAGLDYEIAQVIYDKKLAGIKTFGTSVVEVTSPQNGQVYEICFTRPTQVQVWIRLNNLLVDDSLFPEDGKEQIRESLADFIGTDASSGLKIGQDVIFNRLSGQVYAITGVIDFAMTISGDGNSYSQNNIPVGDREKAVLQLDHIDIP